ncbi:MAG: hypothetical protein AB9897_04340 [Anaerolineaceae bacterium]
MAKYDQLGNFLRNAPGDVKQIKLSFAQIDIIIDEKIPESAYKFPAWWGNDKFGAHVHATAWLEAGWKVEKIDQKATCVLFVRD